MINFWRRLFSPKFRCVICNSRKFRIDEEISATYCLSCESHPRHRALTKKLRTLPILGKTVLEVAPLTPLIYGGVLRELGCEKYVSCDKWPEGNPVDPRNVRFADTYCDIIELDKHYTGETFDYIIVQHVIEEVPDYLAAIEALSKTLNPEDGLALLEIPSLTREDHLSHSENRYGNVWTFSKQKLLDEMSSYFSIIDVWQWEEDGMPVEIFACGR